MSIYKLNKLADNSRNLQKNGADAICPYMGVIPVESQSAIQPTIVSKGDAPKTEIQLIRQPCNSQCSHFHLIKHPQTGIPTVQLTCGSIVVDCALEDETENKETENKETEKPAT